MDKCYIKAPFNLHQPFHQSSKDHVTLRSLECIKQNGEFHSQPKKVLKSYVNYKGGGLYLLSSASHVIIGGYKEARTISSERYISQRFP